MADSLRSMVMEVDLSALRHNLAVVRGLAGRREVIASVKANAYGFGVIEVGRALVDAGVRKLWTGNIDEAIILREAGVDAEILIFGTLEPHQFAEVLRHDFQPTVCDVGGAERLERVAAVAGQRVPVWIKVDAGLGRFGVAIDEAAAFVEYVDASPALELRGLYSHLPFNSSDGARWAGEREKLFGELRDKVGKRRSIPITTQVWGSAGLLSGCSDASSAVCVGNALFGLNPLEPAARSHPPLRPLIHRLSAPVLQVANRHSGASSAAGYGQNSGFRSATLGIGVADGLANARHGCAQVILGEHRCAVRAFTLENLIVEIGDAAVEAFDRAVIIGAAGPASVTIEDWAGWTGLSPLELMQSFSGRVPLHYVGRP